MVFAIPSPEEMKEAGTSTEDDEEELKVGSHFLSPRGDVAANAREGLSTGHDCRGFLPRSL